MSGSSLPTIDDDDTDDDDTFTIGIAKDTSFYEGQEDLSKVSESIGLVIPYMGVQV